MLFGKKTLASLFVIRELDSINNSKELLKWFNFNMKSESSHKQAYKMICLFIWISIRGCYRQNVSAVVLIGLLHVSVVFGNLLGILNPILEVRLFSFCFPCIRYISYRFSLFIHLSAACLFLPF